MGLNAGPRKRSLRAMRASSTWAMADMALRQPRIIIFISPLDVHSGRRWQGGRAGWYYKVAQRIRSYCGKRSKTHAPKKSDIESHGGQSLPACGGGSAPRVRAHSFGRPCLEPVEAPAAVETTLEELKRLSPNLGSETGIDQLLEGHVQVYSTVDNHIQRIANVALENGLKVYEKRHPRSRGLIQGSVVVLRNSDTSILAETGGREVYKGRNTTYSDYNRVTQSKRQPGSAMKPIVYLAAFRQGASRSRYPRARRAHLGSHVARPSREVDRQLR